MHQDKQQCKVPEAAQKDSQEEAHLQAQAQPAVRRTSMNDRDSISCTQPYDTCIERRPSDRSQLSLSSALQAHSSAPTMHRRQSHF